MAQPLTTPAGGMQELGSWHGENVGVGQVLAALADLRRGEKRAATRTSVVNLVMVAPDEDEADRACLAMHRLGTRHPGRTVVLVRQAASGEAGLDAEVRLNLIEAPGHAAWSEDVRLRVRGELGEHLHSLVEPLTLADVPVAVWFLTRLPEPTDLVLDVADAVIVDTRDAESDDVLSRLAELTASHTVLDLSWIRIQPWRELLANLFEVAFIRPFLHGVRVVEVRGKPGPRRLMAGWLSSRLGLPVGMVHLSDARHLAVRLACDHDGVTGTFGVERAEVGRLVRSRAEVDGKPPYEDSLLLPDDALPWSLGRALARLEPHPSYVPSLHAAVSFA